MIVQPLQATREHPSDAAKAALEENRRLRRTMRDLVALSTLPAIWSGRGPPDVASSLADVLLNMLSLDLVCIRLGKPDSSEFVEVVRSKHHHGAIGDGAWRAAVSALLDSGRAELPATIPDPFGTGTLRTATIRFGVGPDQGVLIAGSAHPEFPTEQDRLLLGVGANQTAIVVQRRQVEGQVQGQRELLQVILGSIADAVVATDMDGRVTFVNAAAERMTGCNPGEATGRPLNSVLRIVDGATWRPVDRPLDQDSMDSLRWTERPGPPKARPVLIASDGSERPIDHSAAPIQNTDGETVGMVMVFRDATAQRRAEQHRNARLAITQALNHAATVEEAAVGVLQAVCENLSWEVGLFWLADEARGLLECRAHGRRPGASPDHFVSESRRRTFRAGEGLPGRVWASGRPAWVADLAQDTNFLRIAAAGRDGLRGAFACPITIAGRTLGVIEFYSRLTCELDADLLEMMETAAGNVGQFIERKQAEDELRHSEEELSEFFENATVGLHWVGPDGTILRANRAELEMLGYSREEYLGHHIGEFHADKPVIADILARLTAGEKLTEYPARLRCKDGSIKHVLIDSSVLWKDGKFIHTRCFTRDISERTRAEAALAEARARLHAALEAGSIVTWTWDIPGNRLYADTQLAQLFNLPPSEAEGGLLEHYLASIHPDDVGRVTSTLGQAIARDELYEADYRIVQPDGSVRWVTARGRAERDASGQPVRMPGVLVDITARKLLEEALRDADRRKDEFLATLAHELRNPLAPIRNSLEILKMPRVDADTLQKTRAMMERQVHHLVRLVDDLLDVSRVMRGKIELRREPVELASVVARAVEIVQPLIAVQGHRLELSLPQESLLLEADPVRLAQVLGNLLANAAKYSEANGRIQVSALRHGHEVVLSVKDDGIGIAPDMLPHIFELFVQADHSSTKAQGGLGIGLTLARNLVHMHGGTIEARSAGLAKGSEFIVRLPLPARREEPHAGQNEPEAATARSASGHRLLVVDDNVDAALSFAMLLRLQGHEVEVAHDGAAALAVAASFAPHVVFLDLGMPGMDGYEVARRMRQLPGMHRAVLAALTGWGQEADRHRTAEAGFDHHVVKPPEAAAIERILSAL